MLKESHLLQSKGVGCGRDGVKVFFFFFFISSVADLFSLLKKIKVNGCKCPVTERSVFLQLSFSFTNYLLAAVSFP